MGNRTTLITVRWQSPPSPRAPTPPTQVMVAAGLLARNAARRGRDPATVGEDDPVAGVEGGHGLPAGGRADRAAGGARLPPGRLRLMTCIGASGPLIEEVSAAVHDHDLTVVSVLSGNRNFEGESIPT